MALCVVLIIWQMYYSSTILFLLALGLSKCSVACLLIRLTPDKSHKLLFNAVLVLMGAWTVGSVFAIALQCNLARPWVLVGETCSGSVREKPHIPYDMLTFGAAALAMADHLRLGHRFRGRPCGNGHIPSLEPVYFQIQQSHRDHRVFISSTVSFPAFPLSQRSNGPWLATSFIH